MKQPQQFQTIGQKSEERYCILFMFWTVCSSYSLCLGISKALAFTFSMGRHRSLAVLIHTVRCTVDGPCDSLVHHVYTSKASTTIFSFVLHFSTQSCLFCIYLLSEKRKSTFFGGSWLSFMPVNCSFCDCALCYVLSCV